MPTHVQTKCDACASNPCDNDAQCTIDDASKPYEFTCDCAPGFHGDRCSHRIDACYGQPCMHNGTCAVLEAGRFTCKCAKGFVGQRCETDVDDCANSECKNDAACVDLVNDYRCDCAAGFTGWDCGKAIDYCTVEYNPCANGALCLPDAHTSIGYRCVCQSGYIGINCTVNVDDCAAHLCLNGGACLDGVNAYECDCVGGYSGKYCEMAPISNHLYPRTAACQANSCENVG